jgi:hypothetical protein
MRFEFTLTGVRAMLMHFDDVQWADEIDAWRLDPENGKKKGEKSGDDRRPAWTWIGYCYHDGKHLALPGANLSSCLRKAGARVPMGRQKTFKELAMSGIFIEDEFCEFANDGKQIAVAPLHELIGNTAFTDHVALASKLGFRLDVRRAPIGASKHVRVRARFDHWTVKGTLETTAHEITEDALASIFTQAGRVGLGDWRPGAPRSPGPFGMFETQLKKIG